MVLYKEIREGTRNICLAMFNLAPLIAVLSSSSCCANYQISKLKLLCVNKQLLTLHLKMRQENVSKLPAKADCPETDFQEMTRYIFLLSH